MKKNTENMLATLIFAFAAFAAVPAYPSTLTGDIVDIRVVDQDEKVFGDRNRGSAYLCTMSNSLVTGDDIYIRVRMLVRNYTMVALTGGAIESLTWYFAPGPLGGSVLHPPKLGLMIGAKPAYADYSEYGFYPWQRSGELVTDDFGNSDTSWRYYTDFYFVYRVQPGDFAAPVRLMNAAGTGPASAIDGSAGYFLLNCGTNADSHWILQNSNGESANFWYGSEILPSEIEWPVGGVTDMIVRTYDLSAEGAYVRTIDFDSVNAAGEPYSEGDVWRNVYPGTSDAPGDAPTLVTCGDANTDATTVYIWSDDESVVVPVASGANTILTIEGKSVLKVLIPFDAESVAFSLKGADGAAVGSEAVIHMSPVATGNVMRPSGELVNGAISRRVQVVSVPIQRATTISFAEPERSVFAEGDLAYVNLGLTQPYYRTGYIFLGADSMGQSCVTSSLFLTGAQISEGQTAVATPRQIRFLDGGAGGTYVSLNAFLCYENDPADKVWPYAAGSLDFSVTNVPPQVVSVTAAGQHVIQSGQTIDSVTRGVPQSFSLSVSDVDADLYATGSDAMSVVWEIDGCLYMTFGDPSTNSVKHTFQNAKPAAQVRVWVKDKDMMEYLATPNFTFYVPVTEKPSVSIETNAEGGIFNETDAGTAQITVKLSEPASANLVVRLAGLQAADGGFLKLRTQAGIVEQALDGSGNEIPGAYDIALNMGMSARVVAISDMDGTGETLAGLDLNACVTTAALNADGARWCDLYDPAEPVCVRVQNVAPEVLRPTEDEEAYTNTNASVNTPYPIVYACRDVAADLAAGILVAISIDGMTVLTTNVYDRSSRIYTAEFSSPGAHIVEFFFTDKDQMTSRRSLNYYLRPPQPNLGVYHVDDLAGASWMPGDTVTVRYGERNFGSANAVAPWTDRIMLEGENGSRANLKAVSVAEGLSIGQCVTNTVQAVIPGLVPLAGQVRVVVAADVNGDVEELNEDDNEATSDWLTLGKKLYLTAASDSVKENVASGVRFTVRRSGPVDEATTVSVGTTGGSPSSATVVVNGQDARSPSGVTVTIPAGSVSTMFTVAPIDNAMVDGTRVVSVSVAADGFVGTFVPLTILDDEVPKLTVALDRTSIREGDGVITATVTREGATDEPLTVYLSGTSGSRASYPSSVVIPAGQASATFEISVPNNDTAQVASELTLRASSSGYTSAAVTYTVEDDDVPGVVLTIAPEVVQEGAGASAVVMTLARVDTEDMSKAITVRLTASVANVLIMPKEVVIPANNPYVRQEIGVIDNANVEVDKDVTITGAIVIPGCNCSAQPSSGGEIQTMLRIIDDDSLALKLRVEPLMMKEGQEIAGYITVGQNTVLTEELAVSLYSDNDAEVELPPTVVIPAGETSVRIPVKTLNDGAEDGTVQVNIYAEADGYAPDSKWVFVTDQNLPDVMPVGIEPQYAVATAGESVSVSFVVTNIGYLASKRSVPFSIYCVKGKSAIIEDAGILVFSGMTDGAVDIGASAEVSAIVTVPDITGDCRFAVVVDPDRLITELNDANNTAYSSVVSVSPSYIAEAQVEGERFLQGSAIEINGVAVKADGTTPAANVDVEIYVIKNEFRRQLKATTDAQGRFAATFKPTTSEAGHYVVGASFPGMNATAEQDAFDILGMKRTSDAYLEYNNIPLGDEMSKTVYIRNMSPIALTGISAEVVGVLSGCEIETSFADVLSGDATIPLTLTLRGTDLTSGRDYKEFTLRLTSAEGATLDIPVLYFVQYQQAHIKASPASINTTMTVGQTRYVDFTIYNDGHGDSGKVTILTSPFPWLSIEGGNEIANLASNESAIVTLKLTPGDNVELNNRYTGEIAVNCESGHGKGCVVPFAFKAVSEHTGTLKVDVIDGYTYYLPDAPHVSNATVRISNKYTGEIVAFGTTGVDGTWASGEIGEGKWQLAILANGHKPYYNEVAISPGMETILPPIYLEAQSVSISYSVTPTNIVDTYVVTLVTEYETSVPEPVLVTTFDDRIPNLQEGDQFAFNAIVVNKGLVAVHGVYLEMPTIDGWEFTVGDSGFSLAPEESVVVPIIVRRPRKRAALMAAPGAVTVTKVDCVDVVRTRGYWYCGGDRWWHVYTVQLPTERVCTTTTYTIVPFEEEPRPPAKPGRTGGGGGGYAPGGGGSGTSRIIISRTNCNVCFTKLAEVISDCNKNLKAILDQIAENAKRYRSNYPYLTHIAGRYIPEAEDLDDEDFRLMEDSYKNNGTERPVSHNSVDIDIVREICGADFLVDDTNGSIRDTIGEGGFKAALYKNDEEIVLAFAGTDDGRDGVADVINGACVLTRQYNEAAILLKKVYTRYADSGMRIKVVGHSLGGGLTQYAILANDYGGKVSGVTYNPAGLCKSLIPENVDVEAAYRSIRNYRAPNDYVSYIGYQCGSVQNVREAYGHTLSGYFTGEGPNWETENIKFITGLCLLANEASDWKDKETFKDVSYEKHHEAMEQCLENLLYACDGIDGLSDYKAYEAFVNGKYPELEINTGYSSIDTELMKIATAFIANSAKMHSLKAIFGGSYLPSPSNTSAKRLLQTSLEDGASCLDYSEEWLSAKYSELESFCEACIKMFREGGALTSERLISVKPGTVSDAAVEAWVSGVDISAESILTNYDKTQAALVTIEKFAYGEGYDSSYEMLVSAFDNLDAILRREQNAICASVTLELSQEVTMTREAFLGTLSVSNGHSSKPITDMEMELEITDENGERCEKLFQPENAGLVTMQGVSILAGGVSLAANSSGSANILFTPNTKAAQTVPKVYYFGGTVTYTDPFVGETVRVKLQPAVPVTVHPSPELTFHYFLQRDVIGDDPFTRDVVEESEPAEVALLILNKGYGDAENVTIKTAEPTIAENEKELKVDFNWIGAALDGASTRLGYRNVDVGTVPAQGSRLAQWWLTSSLQGHFTKVDGSYTRLNSNGNPDFDLIKDVITHTLVRSIMADNDTLPDFLVTEGRFDGIPNVIYMDNGETVDVSEATDVTISGAGANATLTVVPGATGWNYASCRHPFGGGSSISRVTRGDGSEVPLRNVWLTSRTFEDGVDPIVEDRIHIADEMVYGIASTYTIEFGGATPTVDRPQVLGFFGVSELIDGIPAAIEVQFSHDVDATTFDVSDLTLYHQGTAVADLSGLSISASGTSGRFAISGFGNLGLGSGTYVLTVQASGVKDLAGISGKGSKSVLWTVVGDTTPPAQIADLAISPDGGFSDTDGVTYTGALTVTGTLPEAGLTVEIIARYVGGGETVLATIDGEGAVATQFSQDITLPGSGNVTLVVRLTDAAGNSSDTEKNIFVDGIALTGTLTGASEDEGLATAAATLTFSDRVMDDDVTIEKFSLTRDGEVVALEGVTFARVDDTTFTLTSLDALCAEDGVYVLTFNDAAVRKYTSGLTMGGSPVMRWRYENPDREPPTVTEVLFDGETPHEAYTNVFSSVSVTFSEAVNVPELIANGLIGRAARVDLLDAANSVTGSAVIASAMTWDGESNTLSWQIDPLAVPAGRTRLMLDAGLIKDLAGNHLAADGYAATDGMRTYTLSETVLAQVNAQAMPTWYNGELYVGEKTADNKGKIRHYAANGTGSYLQSEGVDIEIPAQGCQGASVAFADMDGDGVVETYVGTTGGDVLKYPGGTAIASLGANRAMPYVYDIDGDGCDELVVGGMDGRIRVISRGAATGTYSMTVLADVNGAALTVPNGRAAPVVADINHDGLADIVSGDTAGNVWAYLGEGTAWCAAPITVFTNNVSLADRSRLGYGDVNKDGIADLIVGRSDGSVTVMYGAETPSPAVPFAVKAVVSASAGTHGAITPVGDVTYDGGDAPEYTITPNVGYHVVDVQVDGVSIGVTNGYVFAPLTTSHAIHADFAAVHYSITYTGLKGAVNTNPETYTVEDAITFAAPGEIYGWVFKGWTPVSIALGSTGAVEVTANWERQKFDVTVNGETKQYNYEDVATFTTDAVINCGATQYVCKGWSATNADPASGEGARAEFRVLGDVALDWQWETNVVTIAQAANAETLDWTTGGVAKWMPAWDETAADGLHQVQCGKIPNGTNAWISTTVEGPGTMTFKWRSALASRNTKYQLVVDGEVKGMLTGTNEWADASVMVLGDRAHEIKWRLMTGRSGAAFGDIGALDCVTWVPSVPPTLAEALNTNLVWATEGGVLWRGVARESLTDSRDAWAVVSGLGDDGSAAVQTRVYGSGVLTFDWAISCEEDYDWMELTVDGEVRDYISGEYGWISSAVEIVGEGWHVVRWEYIKDEMDDPGLVGDNVAKLDDVVWTSNDEPPAITETQTTPVPVPYVELEGRFSSYLDEADGDYEAAAHMIGRNGCAIWESYVAGLVPDDENSKFIAKIEMLPDGTPKVTWAPDTPELRATRTYTTYGKKTLLDRDWVPVTDANKDHYHFFKVEVKLK